MLVKILNAIGFIKIIQKKNYEAKSVFHRRKSVLKAKVGLGSNF